MNLTFKQSLIALLTLTSLGLSACAPQNSGALNSGSTAPPKNSASSNDLKVEAKSEAKTADAGKSLESRRVSFVAPDKVEIIGTFYQSAAERAPAVIMLHQWGANRASYNDFAKELQTSGFNVLTIDGRGFGESVKQGEQKIAPSSNASAVVGMLSDVAAAQQFLEQQPNTDAQRLGIVGASYGSSLAIIHAAKEAKIKAVALLSPGINYFGNLATENPVQQFGARSLLLVAAEDDAESAAAARRLDSLASGNQHQLKIFKSGGHGTGLFKADVNLETLLKDFFTNSLK